MRPGGFGRRLPPTSPSTHSSILKVISKNMAKFPNLYCWQEAHSSRWDRLTLTWVVAEYRSWLWDTHTHSPSHDSCFINFLKRLLCQQGNSQHDLGYAFFTVESRHIFRSILSHFPQSGSRPIKQNLLWHSSVKPMLACIPQPDGLFG